MFLYIFIKFESAKLFLMFITFLPDTYSIQSDGRKLGILDELQLV